MFILTLFYKYDLTQKRSRTDKEKRIRFHDPFFSYTKFVGATRRIILRDPTLFIKKRKSRTIGRECCRRRILCSCNISGVVPSIARSYGAGLCLGPHTMVSSASPLVLMLGFCHYYILLQ